MNQPPAEDPRRELRESLRNLAEATSHRSAPPSVEAALRREFQRRRRRTLRRRVFMGMGASLAAGVTLMLLRQGGLVGGPSKGTEEHARVPPEESIAAFVSLGPVERASEAEHLRVLRMRVPAVMLASMGWPTLAAAEGDTVLSDALVGEDGSILAVHPVGWPQEIP
ncbi:hypothetical protein [Myxococcus stipitatus]|uniref:hypothetical protein n=1 Tax=Myxococcus stipitatus TaxID=83455 RepID=UPI0030D3E534